MSDLDDVQHEEATTLRLHDQDGLTESQEVGVISEVKCDDNAVQE